MLTPRGTAPECTEDDGWLWTRGGTATSRRSHVAGCSEELPLRVAAAGAGWERDGHGGVRGVPSCPQLLPGTSTAQTPDRQI